MNRAIAAAALTIATACLGACGDADRNDAATIDKAEGEILEPAVADDMLPYDTLRSQPPLADPEEAKKSGAAGRGPGSGAGAAEGEAPPAPSKAAAPAGAEQSQPRPDAE